MNKQVGRPKKALIDHLKDGTYRRDRHGDVPEELEKYKAKQRRYKESFEAWLKNHPNYYRNKSKKRYRAQRDKFLKDHPDWFEQKKEKHKEAILRKKAKKYFRENGISPQGVPAELIALKCDQLKLIQAVRALKKNKGANLETVEH